MKLNEFTDGMTYYWVGCVLRKPNQKIMDSYYDNYAEAKHEFDLLREKYKLISTKIKLDDDDSFISDVVVLDLMEGHVPNEVEDGGTN